MVVGNNAQFPLEDNIWRKNILGYTVPNFSTYLLRILFKQIDVIHMTTVPLLMTHTPLSYVLHWCLCWWHIHLVCFSLPGLYNRSVFLITLLERLAVKCHETITPADCCWLSEPYFSGIYHWWYWYFVSFNY